MVKIKKVGFIIGLITGASLITYMITEDIVPTTIIVAVTGCIEIIRQIVTYYIKKHKNKGLLINESNGSH